MKTVPEAGRNVPDEVLVSVTVKWITILPMPVVAVKLAAVLPAAKLRGAPESLQCLR